MKKGILILICFSCLTGFSHGQNKRVDSLLQVLKTAKEDTAKVSTLIALANEFASNNPDTAIYFANQAQVLAITLNYKMGIANALLTKSSAEINLGNYEKALKNINDALTIYDQLFASEKSAGKSKTLKQKAIAYNNTANIYNLQADYPKALDYYQKALKIEEELKNKTGIIQQFGSIANIYAEQSDYSKALDYYFKVLKIAEELASKKIIAKTLGNIGLLYRNLHEYPKALDYYLKSLRIKEELGDKRLLANMFNNIGALYEEQDDFRQAFIYFSKALTLSKECGDKNLLAKILGNFGSAYNNHAEQEKKSGKIGIDSLYSKALDYDFRALKIKETSNDKEGITITLGNIGIAYMHQKKFKEAEKYLKKSLDIAEEIGSLDDIKVDNESLCDLYSQTGNFKKALEHFRKAMVLKDTLFNEEIDKQITRKEMNYEFEKKQAAEKAEHEKHLAVANVEIKKQKLLRNFLIGGIGLVLVLFFFVYRIYRARQALRLNDIRNRIAGDLHDDIGSTLNSISIYSEVAKKKDEHHDEALEMIGDASRKIIDAMSDIVWTINPENDNFAKIIFRMKSLAYNLFHAKKIEFTFHADEILNEKKLSIEERRNFFLIFKEAVNNLVKYSNATRAAITLTNENNWIRLRIQDDGVGFDTSQDNAGNGLKNMKRRAVEMKGQFKIESQIGRGTQIELILKS